MLLSLPPEPDDFDWRGSFVQTTKTEFNYDPSLINQLSNKAMFYVTIRTREESKEVTKINKDGTNIYERYRTNYYKVNGDDFNDGLCVMINTNGESHYSGLFSRTGLNLQADNPQQLQLANGPSTTTNVAAFGIENPELGMWRLFYWGKNNLNNIPTNLSSWDADGQGFFQAYSDEFATETFERNVAAYQMRQATSQTEAPNLLSRIERCSNPFYFLANIVRCVDASERYPKVLETIEGYERGIEWFMNSSDFWEELNGGLTFEAVKSTSGTCICGSGPSPEPTPNSFSIPCSQFELGSIECDDFLIFVPNIEIAEVRRESDMVVLAESASAFPGAVHTFRMEGSNHFNMRNDNNTKTLLLDVFSGNKQFNLEFFETEERS